MKKNLIMMLFALVLWYTKNGVLIGQYKQVLIVKETTNSVIFFKGYHKYIIKGGLIKIIRR